MAVYEYVNSAHKHCSASVRSSSCLFCLFRFLCVYLLAPPSLFSEMSLYVLSKLCCEAGWRGDTFPGRQGSHFSPAAHSQPVTKWARAAPLRLQRAAASEPPQGLLMSGNPILQPELEDFRSSYPEKRRGRQVVLHLAKETTTFYFPAST